MPLQRQVPELVLVQTPELRKLRLSDTDEILHKCRPDLGLQSQPRQPASGQAEVPEYWLMPLWLWPEPPS
ncbi:hypothetical protein D3C73_1592380 [compost metagenome]